MRDVTYRPGVDAVVVNYQTPDDLTRFTASWVAHRPVDMSSRLRIVNVSPTPADSKVANSYVEPDLIDVVEYFDNIGYGRACNLGAQRGGDGMSILALFNADIELTEGAVEQCAEALMSEPTWGVLGPRQVDDRRRLVHAGIVGPNTRPAHRGWMEPDRGQYTDVLTDVPTVSGSAYFIKRRLWQELTECPFYQEAAR